MTTYIQRPTSDGPNTGGNIDVINNGGTVASPPFYPWLADNTDVSYVRLFGTTNTIAENLPIISLAQNEAIRQYRVVLRWNAYGNGTASLSGACRDSLGNTSDTDYYNTTNNSFATYYGAWRTVAPDNSALTPGKLAAIYMTHAANSTSPQVADIWLEIQTNFAPTVTGSNLGTITTNSRPTISWTYSDPEGDAQERFRVRIFNAAAYNAINFDPLTARCFYDSGEVFSAATSWTPPDPLPNDTYRAFISVSDVGSNGRYSVVNPAGPYSSFVLAVTSPATPSISGVVDVANMRATLTLSDQQNMLSADDASFEVTTGSWVGITNASVSRSTAQALNGGASLAINSLAVGRVDVGIPSGTYATPVAPNTVYSAMASLLAATVGRTCVLYVYWFKSNGQASATVFSTIGTAADLTTGFVSIAGTVTSPPDAAYGQIVVSIQTAGAANEVHYLDNVSLAPGVTSTWTRGGLNSSARFSLQRSDDGGLSWITLTRAYVPGSGVSDLSGIDYSDLTEQLVVYGYEAPRNINVQYRVRVTALVGSAVLVSAYSAPITLTIPATGWWLKSISDPTKNWRFYPALADLEWKISYDEAQGVMHPLGRTREVVMSDAVTGAHIVWDASMTTDAEYAAYTALRLAQSPMLLQTPFGDQFYVRFVGAHSVMRIVDGDTNEQRRTVAASLVEIDVS